MPSVEVGGTRKFKKYALDTILSIVFWVPAVGIWSYAVTGLEGWELLSVIAGTALINAALGGLYGRLLTKWRIALKYD